MNIYFPIVLIIFVILWLIIYFANNYDLFEGWVPYSQEPYEYIKTGSSPLTFYMRNRYKKPYRYPYQYYKSYPVPNLSYNP